MWYKIRRFIDNPEMGDDKFLGTNSTSITDYASCFLKIKTIMQIHKSVHELTQILIKLRVTR